MGAVIALDVQGSVYRPIADYGVIGEGRTLALIAQNGSIDWWCPGRFDAPSVFGAILDVKRGGRFRVGPIGDAQSVSRYVEDTNVLETEHTAATGRVVVRDTMPFEMDLGVDDNVILRRVRCIEGSVDMEAIFAPRFQYGRVFPRFSAAPTGLLASGAGEILHLRAPLAWVRTVKGERRAVFSLAAGESVDLLLRHAPFASPVPFAQALAMPDDALEAATIVRWRNWSAATRHEGPDAPLVRRSALALKLLQYRKNGAFVAAGTTSLPEAIRGVRNWDYRFTWVRDGAFTAKALMDAGHADDAGAFVGWLNATVGTNADAMRIMYTLSGSTELPERVLVGLEGYRESAPVRVGNGAAHQRQLDVYGELVDFLHASRAEGDGCQVWPLACATAEWVVEHWREPDQGIWEMRAEPRHFVLSKAMAWVALERAQDIARAIGEVAPARWRSEADAIRADVFTRGVDGARGFVQAYGFPQPDASNLLLPLVGFVDPRDPRMLATVDTILADLTVDGLAYRYLGDDGLPGGEGTFAYCTFWLVEVLAKQGRVREARVVFDRIVGRATHLGLYAEEIDATSGEHLGNFPQAFPHAGLIQAARALAAAEGSG